MTKYPINNILPIGVICLRQLITHERTRAYEIQSKNIRGCSERGATDISRQPRWLKAIERAVEGLTGKWIIKFWRRITKLSVFALRKLPSRPQHSDNRPRTAIRPTGGN